jgi:hypothetical protein
MINVDVATITRSAIFGWSVAFFTIAALALAGRRNQKAGYKRHRTNDVLDVLMAWARANEEMYGPRQHPTSDFLNLAFAAGQQVPIGSSQQTYQDQRTENSMPVSAATSSFTS